MIEQGNDALGTPEAAPVGRDSRIAIVVLGMHRTGTSAMAGVLHLLGAAAPKHLQAPRASNAKGNWESRAIMRLNDRILQVAGSHWKDWSPFDADRLPTESWRGFETEIAETIAGEFADARMILLKDPRMCRLMAPWLGALERAGIAPRIVMPVRNPLDAALSLRDRNGMAVEEGMLLWLRYMLEAERKTRGLRRCFVPLGALLEDWRAAVDGLSRALQVAWPVPLAAASAEIDRFLAPGLRHHHSSDEDLRSAGTFDWVPATYEILMQFCAGQPPERGSERLDSIRRDFDQVSRVLGRVSLQKSLEAEAAAERFRSYRRQARIDQLRARIALHKAQWQNRELQEAFGWRALDLLGRFGSSAERSPRSEAEMAALIVASGLFERDWYLETYADVRSSGIDPALHYLRTGAAEDRNPSPLFSAVAYKRRYPDVVAAGLNPLVHFLELGIEEGRRFDPVSDDGTDELGPPRS